MVLIMNGLVVVGGLLLALVFDSAGGYRSFGWMFVVLGVLGLLSRLWVARREPPSSTR